MCFVSKVYMFKTVSNALVIGVMLVAFVGQAIAFNAAVSCDNSIDVLALNFNELVKHYDPKPIDANNLEDCCGIECCDVDCTCIVNACSLLTYINTEADSTKTLALSEAVYTQQFEQPKFISTLLYRPPIFIS